MQFDSGSELSSSALTELSIKDTTSPNLNYTGHVSLLCCYCTFLRFEVQVPYSDHVCNNKKLGVMKILGFRLHSHYYGYVLIRCFKTITFASGEANAAMRMQNSPHSCIHLSSNILNPVANLRKQRNVNLGGGCEHSPRHPPTTLLKQL